MMWTGLGMAWLAGCINVAQSIIGDTAEEQVVSIQVSLYILLYLQCVAKLVHVEYPTKSTKWKKLYALKNGR